MERLTTMLFFISICNGIEIIEDLPFCTPQTMPIIISTDSKENVCESINHPLNRIECEAVLNQHSVMRFSTEIQ